MTAAGRADWYRGHDEDAARRRGRRPQAEPFEDPVDEVILSAEPEQGNTDTYSADTDDAV